MTNVIRTAGGLIVLTAVWVALTEQRTWPNLVLGLFAALISLILIRSLHQGQQNLRWSFKGIALWLVYLIWLLGQIYLSGIYTIIHIFRGRMKPVLVSIKTELRDDFLIAVLAASVTLTPGTVTVSRDGSILNVLWLNPSTDNSDEAAVVILGRLERLLMKQEHQRTSWQV